MTHWQLMLFNKLCFYKINVPRSGQQNKKHVAYDVIFSVFVPSYLKIIYILLGKVDESNVWDKIIYWKILFER